MNSATGMSEDNDKKGNVRSLDHYGNIVSEINVGCEMNLIHKG
jgi:S-adenosylmethionine hydrolase